MSTGKPFVSVIVPALNEERNIPRLLDRLSRQTYGLDAFEIFIVDNGSTDGTIEKIQSAGLKNLRLIEEKENRSAEAARNTALPVARGSIFAFTDADCDPHEGWLENGITALLREGTSMVAGRVEFRFESGDPSLAELYDSVNFLQNDLGVAHRQIAFTCNLFVRREVFEKVPLFPYLKGGHGDSLFTALAAKNGFSLSYSDSATITHPARRLRPLVKKVYHLGISQIRMASQIHKRPLVGLFRKPHLLNLNPYHLRERLNYHRLSVGSFRFLALWIFSGSMAVIAATFAAWGAVGSLINRRLGVRRWSSGMG